jgi:hypothetical protein
LNSLHFCVTHWFAVFVYELIIGARGPHFRAKVTQKCGKSE